MPGHGMERQKPVGLQKTGRLSEGNSASQKIIQHHKAQKAFLHLAGLQKRSDQAQIHRYRAELERKYPPGVVVVVHVKVEEKLFINLGDCQENTRGLRGYKLQLRSK